MHRVPGFRKRVLSLTSLIDVIFLLLLFFMLTSTFSQKAELALLAAGSAAPGSSPPAFVRLSPDAVLVNGRPAAWDAVVAEVAGLKPAVVLVSLAGPVTAQRLADLLAVLRGLPVAVLG